MDKHEPVEQHREMLTRQKAPKPGARPRSEIEEVAAGNASALKRANEEVYKRDPIMRFFEYEHLPAKLQPMSKDFHDLAWGVWGNLPPSAERTTALRKLLEGKDAAVRAAL